MDGRRTALIVANDQYTHEGLRALIAPEADARALAEVLGDPAIGGFDVDIVRNEPAHVVQAHIEDLFAQSRRDDLLLLHFSCHGLKNDAGQLYFAARDTRPDRLASTAIPAEFVQGCMRSARARSIVLFLDCCYGGAFGEGVSVRASGSAHVLDSFPAGRLGGGRGRAVITASSAMEYAFEGGTLADQHQQEPSIFTSALVDGLGSGEADRDEDGLVSLNELYDYVFDRVRERNPLQTPGRDVEMQGDLYLARSSRRRIRPVPIPRDVEAALRDENVFTRLGAVSELRARLTGRDVGAALGAHAALEELARTDIKYISDAAAEALAQAVPTVAETALDFGELVQGAASPSLVLRVGGPPVARSCTYAASAGVVVADADDGVEVSVDTSTVGALRGAVTVKAPTGEVTVPVTATVTAPEVTTPAPAARAALVAASPAPTESVGAGPTEAVPARASSAAPASSNAPPPSSPAQPAAPPSPVTDAPTAGLLRYAGWSALLAGPLMSLGVYLPYLWDASMRDQEAEASTWPIVLGLAMLAAGALTLWPRRTGRLGPGMVLGLAVACPWGLWGLGALVASRDGPAGFQYGLWVEVLAHLLGFVAGGLVLLGLRREGTALRRVSRRDRLAWLGVATAAAAGLALLRESALLADWSESLRSGHLAWGALLALVAPLAVVVVRDRALRAGLAAGWILGALALTVPYWVGFAEDPGHRERLLTFTLTLAVLAVLVGLLARRDRLGRQAPIAQTPGPAQP